MFDTTTKSIIRAEKQILLTEDEIEAIYRYKEKQYRIADAKRHAMEMGMSGLSEVDYANLACLFDNAYDCNMDENSIWERVIENYNN